MKTKTFVSGEIIGLLRIVDSKGYLNYMYITDQKEVDYEFKDRNTCDDIVNKADKFCQKNDSTLWSF